MRPQAHHSTTNPAGPSGGRRLRVRLSQKVFFIGFNKCATRSFHRFFHECGVRSYHAADKSDVDDAVVKNLIQGKKALDTVDQYDVYLDTEAIRLNFRALDHDYPGSKFILNVRDINQWLLSRLNHADGTYVQYMNDYHGVNRTWQEWVAIWRREFLEHDQAVSNYFRGRDDQFLRFDVGTNSLADLVEFIGHDCLQGRDGLPRVGVTEEWFFALVGDRFIEIGQDDAGTEFA
jgi:hypothetical protein